MNKIAHLFLFSIIPLFSAFSQIVLWEDYPPFEILYSIEKLKENEKEIIFSLEKYYKKEKYIKEFFLQNQLNEIIQIIKNPKSIFFLERPLLEKGQKKTQIQFWVKEENKTPIRGFVSIENNEITNLSVI